MQHEAPKHGESRMEIERVFLLRPPPTIPSNARQLRIEQGYLPGDGSLAGLEGRLRRTVLPDGKVLFHHTVKRGSGMVREETERAITREEFERHWPATSPLRLSKSRYEVSEAGLVWQIDIFDRPAGLVLAEVELPQPDTPVNLPAWIAAVFVREVTEDPSYRNSAIAKRLAEEKRR